MNTQQILGIVLMVIGVGAAIFGLNASDSASDQFSKLFTGHFTDATALYIVGGSVVAVVGLVLLLTGSRAATA